ncbi:helix-turn-helix domain-containing protein [Pseudarthrobacter sp. NPDC092439]|uniref:helix-turn-helix domain-containing protein n=1 Tax=unclassified Pseudarthrobacter TaxID=2647000 RepID=UPI00382B4469
MATETNERPTLTVAEAKEIAGVGLSQMYAAIKEGKVPSVRIGRRILIPRKKFMAMLDGDAA